MNGTMKWIRTWGLTVIVNSLVVVVVVAVLLGVRADLTRPAPFSYDAGQMQIAPVCSGDEVMLLRLVGTNTPQPNVTISRGTIHRAGGPPICTVPTQANIETITGDVRSFDFVFPRPLGECADLPPGEYSYHHGTTVVDAVGSAAGTGQRCYCYVSRRQGR